MGGVTIFPRITMMGGREGRKVGTMPFDSCPYLFSGRIYSIHNPLCIANP